MEGCLKVIPQSKDKPYAYDLKAGASLSRSNEVVTGGGYLRAERGAKSIKLVNVGSKSEVHGRGEYFIGIFNKPVDLFIWDNSEYLNDPDWWICSSGSSGKPGEQPGEAALRFESKVKKARITGVKFRCGKWTNKEGKRDWWKEVVQIRFTDDTEFNKCLFVGPTTFGKQDNDKLGQVVKLVTWRNCGFTHKPRMSKHRSSIKKFVFVDCYWIDENGKPTGKKFPNQTW